MKSFISTPIRYSLVLLIVALLVSSCSSSSDSDSGESQTDANPSDTNGDGVVSDEGTDSVANEMENTTTGDTTSGTEAESADGIDESTTGSGLESASDAEGLSTTRVDFDITVPVYSSDALRVRLIWGDIDTTAMWNSDELWTVSVDFPASTENQLVVTFSDDNGAITLGSIERSFTTSTNQSESVQITADEFDTDRWDSDGDGESNLSEAIAGTYTQGSDVLELVQPTLELVADKTFRISWQLSSDAQFYRVLENPDGNSGYIQISDDLGPSIQSYDHRVALYNRANARYIVQACDLSGCVDSDEQLVSDTLESAIGYFKAGSSDQGDNFGHAVDLSADGNTLVIGALFEDGGSTGINVDQLDNSAPRSGAVYVFERINGSWQPQAYLKASNTDELDYFGGSVSLSADGNTLVVGAYGEDSSATGVNGEQSDNTILTAGAAYVFSRVNGTWEQQAYLKASKTGEFDSFGITVNLSADGNTLAASGRDAIYIFTRISGEWQQESNIPDEGEDFGLALSLSADGNTMVVGASRNAENLGAVYVFVRVASSWQQQAYVKASNPDDEDLFGGSISLSADGNTFVVGASGDDSSATGVNGVQSRNAAKNSGAAYVFSRLNETWEQQAYLKASNTDEFDWFGSAVDLSADGAILAIGALRESSVASGINGDQNDNSADNTGAVYLFVRTDGGWRQQAYLKASNPGSRDEFGGSVSLSADGKTLAVGAVSEDSSATDVNGNQSDNSTVASGAVYLF